MREIKFRGREVDKMKLYGHEIDGYLDIRKKMLLERVKISDMIYIVQDEAMLYCIQKKDVTLSVIEEYKYVGKLYGLDVYVNRVYLDNMSALYKENQ